jgi:hypothetical protein
VTSWQPPHQRADECMQVALRCIRLHRSSMNNCSARIRLTIILREAASRACEFLILSLSWDAHATKRPGRFPTLQQAPMINSLYRSVARRSILSFITHRRAHACAAMSCTDLSALSQVGRNGTDTRVYSNQSRIAGHGCHRMLQLALCSQVKVVRRC